LLATEKEKEHNYLDSTQKKEADAKVAAFTETRGKKVWTSKDRIVPRTEKPRNGVFPFKMNRKEKLMRKGEPTA